MKGLCAGLLLIALMPLSWAENRWPVPDWQSLPTQGGPALAAFEHYSFPPRQQERRGVRTDAVVVVQDGRIRYERYQSPNRAETPHLLWSASKGVFACVLGLAWDQGVFQLNDPVAQHYPPMKAHPKVRIRDLLYWASGLDWNESYEFAPWTSTVIHMLYTLGYQDMADFVANLPEDQAPGSHYRYSSGDSNLLSASLKTTVGESNYADLPWLGLFEPLGIQSAVWESDDSGTYVASSYLYMTARDLARLGLLMARHGEWNGQRLLSQDWLHVMLTPFEHYQPGQDEAVPGGQWWLNRAIKGAPPPWPSVPESSFALLGHWGQALYVIPDRDLIIVRFADDRDGSFQHHTFLKLALAAFGKMP